MKLPRILSEKNDFFFLISMSVFKKKILRHDWEFIFNSVVLKLRDLVDFLW